MVLSLFLSLPATLNTFHTLWPLESTCKQCDWFLFYLPVSTPNTGGSAGPVGSSSAPTAVFPLPGTFPWANSSRGKPRRGMMRRAVFSDLQRKGLEKRFQSQKYISKPDRKKLAEKLGLKDSQVRFYVLCCLLGNSPASEFYMPTFRNTLPVPSS